jgi:pyrimidine 5'-nucleotidase
MPLPRARRHRPQHTARTPVWLFDLDNTLHGASHAIFPVINEAMTQYIIDALGVSREEADHLRTSYTRRYGAALLGLTRHHPVDPHDFLKVVHTLPDLRAMLVAERGLARMIAALPGRKIVLTNGPEAYARAVLAELGIERLFERVVAIEDMRTKRTRSVGRASGAQGTLATADASGATAADATPATQETSGAVAANSTPGTRSGWRAKPDRAMLRETLRRVGASLSEAILIEDTRGHLKRYRRLGIQTVWITGFLPTHPMTMRAGLGGRPHYVDHRIRSIKSLQLGLQSGRLRQTG